MDAPPPLPPALRRDLLGATWRRVTIGLSGAEVYRVEASGAPTRYLKLATGARMVELRAERERLRWLTGRLPVPRALAWAEEAAGDAIEAWRGYLLLSEAPGVMASDPLAMRDPARIARLLAEGLWRIHRLPVDDCPFDERLETRLSKAAWVIAQGIADEEAVRDDWGMSATALLRRLTGERPLEPTRDLVVTHGDYCPPNILLALAPSGAAEGVSGYLDWGRGGVADRHQDLAIGARSVRHNLGAEWEATFLAAYAEASGSQPDPARLAYYETLDELF